ncbi:hepatic sodium/bile acid cotransporter-like [Styela clava]|uniref:sodium/bile acid cotransporter-like n=1 Tax=Styela clava TaxID=7725 RepID=UPI00193A1221|nr:sodium/bile acid cotransporter-like [Styela clava]
MNISEFFNLTTVPNVVVTEQTNAVKSTTITTDLNTTLKHPSHVFLDEPIFDGDPHKIRLSQSLTALSILILVEVMLGLGCSVEIDLLRKHIKKPIGILVAGFTQFILMPLIAFGLAKAANLSSVPALATLVTASVPGGILSNILACLIKGDMSLSILMTTTSTILALAFIPLNLFLYGSHWLPVDTGLGTIVPYSSIILSFALMIGPTLCGIFIKWKWPEIAGKITTVCKVLLILTISALIVISVFLYETELLRNIPPKLWLIAIFMPAIGFTLGFIGSTICGLRGSARKTVAIETGCQNSHMGAAILKVAFPAQMIGSFFLFPLVYGGLQFLEGVVLVIITLLYMQLTPESAQETNFGDDDSSKAAKEKSMWQKLEAWQQTWLSRRGASDKQHILPGEKIVHNEASGIVTTVAQDIADEASRSPK